MLDELVTIDTILAWFTKQVSEKYPISPEDWLNGCQRMIVLLQGEQEKLYEMEQEIAKARNILLDSDKSVAYAKSRIEELDIYKNARKQKSKIENCLEMIRVAKLQSRMASDIMRGQI